MKESIIVTTIVVAEASKIASQLPLKYYKYTIYLASFSFISRLLNYNQNAIYEKPSYKRYKKKFDSNNKLYKYLDTYFATKRKIIAKVVSIISSNTDIAVKKEEVDHIATTTTIAVVEISLPAS